MPRFLFGFIATIALAQVPLEDWRNTYTPDPWTHFDMPRYRTLAAWQAHRDQLRNQILAAAGMLPLRERPPMRALSIRAVESNGVWIETLLLETLPGYFIGANVYRPLTASGRLPAVLSPHGHWRHGRLENQPSYSVPALGINMARQGYVVLTWDMVGYNDARQTPHDFGGWREDLWSFHPLGLQLWNSIRALDYLISRPDVDPRRIGITGASGGATQSFLLTAVDDRIGYSAPVAMISATAQGGDACEEAPNLRLGTYNVEFAAMMAPRPMLMVSDTGDWTRDTPRVEFPDVRSIYSLFGRSGDIGNVHVSAGHNYNRQSREAVYAFFAKHMLHGGVPDHVSEQDIRLENPEQLRALPDGRPPAGAVNYDALFSRWRENVQRDAAALSDTALRERLRAALGAEWPQHVESTPEGDRIVLSRPGQHDRVSGIWIPGSEPVALVVSPDGAQKALHSPEVQQRLRAGRFVLAIDAFQTGSARAERDRESDYFLSYNQTDDANRVQDILTSLAFLQNQFGSQVELVGLKRAGIWSLFAAAVAPLPVWLTADQEGFQGTDDDFHDRFFVPGIQWAGGLEAARRLAYSYEAVLPTGSQP